MTPTIDDNATALDALLRLDHPLKMQVAQWAEATIPERTDSFDRARWKAAADAGLLGVRVPEAWGGGGASTVETLLHFEGLGLGSADGGLAFALASAVFSTQTSLCEVGTEAQRERWLPPMVAGDAIGCFAMTEPDVGSHTASITTTAVEQTDGSFVLSGEKRWITLAPVADFCIVFATEDPAKGTWGISAFLVPLDAEGVELGETETKAGLQSCPFSRVRLDGVTVPADAVVGRRGAGMAIFTSAVESERAFLHACQLGAMERILDRAVERARTRVQGGVPIGAHQAVGHRLADMKMRHEVARLLVYKAGLLHDRDASVTMATALTKMYAPQAAVDSAIDAVKIFGAEGIGLDAGLSVEVGDALAGFSYSGTPDIQRNIVTRLLGADRAPRGNPS